ncbi:MAG TPA: hypothetical protein PKK10_04930 [Woeseiaceae bacterium]|nr:hypothetical protein [Woeseiaceae bacterium]
MAFESTITEHDLDSSAQKFVQSARGENYDIELDLVVDGMRESILSRILGLFSRSGH